MPVAQECNQNASDLIYALPMYFSHALIGLNLLTLTGNGSDALPLATRSARFCTRSKRRSVRREALTYF